MCFPYVHLIWAYRVAWVVLATSRPQVQVLGLRPGLSCVQLPLFSVACLNIVVLQTQQ